MSELTPLSVKVEDKELVLRIGIDNLKWGFENMEENNPYDPKSGKFIRLWKVTDAEEFAKDVVHEMLDEDEVGNTPLYRFFDCMCNMAADNGSIAVDEDGQIPED